VSLNVATLDAVSLDVASLGAVSFVAVSLDVAVGSIIPNCLLF